MCMPDMTGYISVDRENKLYIHTCLGTHYLIPGDEVDVEDVDTREVAELDFGNSFAGIKDAS